MEMSVPHSAVYLMAVLVPLTAFAQVNSGSDGRDGALNPASNRVIDMADHPHRRKMRPLQPMLRRQTDRRRDQICALP